MVQSVCFHFNAPVPAAQCWHIGGQLAEAGSGYVLLGHCHSAVYVKGHVVTGVLGMCLVMWLGWGWGWLIGDGLSS